ncbi:MAG: ACT domain-containing protein, partial [Clostridia bacterium]
CSLFEANIQDISQTVLSEYFAMIMLVDISKLNIKFGDFVDKLKILGEENNLIISAMHEDIFNSMHRI